MSPKRVQMSRQQPWRADNPDAVIVARPTVFSNPWKVGDEIPAGMFGGTSTVRITQQLAVDLFRAYALEYVDSAYIRSHLTGRDLACWCPLDQPCHADVLLELANGTT